MTETEQVKKQLTKRDKTLTALILGLALVLIAAGESLSWSGFTRVTAGSPLILLAWYLAATYGGEAWVPSMARINAALGWIAWIAVAGSGALWVTLIGLWATPFFIEQEIAGDYARGTALAVAITSLILAAGIFMGVAKYAGTILEGARDK